MGTGGDAAAALVRPGPVWGPYPMREEAPGGLQALHAVWRLRRERPAFLARLRALRAAPAVPLPEDVVAPRWRARLRTEGFGAQVGAEVMHRLALLVQRELGFLPHEPQMLAAWTMLQGSLVEMATGEGKTVATFLAAATAALAGVPVHVLTANDYLAERDARRLEPLYRALGLSSGWIASSLDDAARRAAYACDVVHAPARELAFDHLRDRVDFGRPDGSLAWQARGEAAALERARPRLRGLCLALIDEADSVLCDEARVPLVLAAPAPPELPEAVLRTLLAQAGAARAGVDFVLDGGEARLTPAGRAGLAALAAALPRPWSDARWHEDGLRRALAAQHRLQRDRDYVVQDGAVVLVDALTGRAAPERQWSRGLHALLAIKEGLAPPAAQRTLAQLTYRRLFARYHRLGGLSGTLAEVGPEMALAYGTPVLRVARHRASRLELQGTRVFAEAQARWQAVGERAAALAGAGRAVLIGTASVADSERIAALLRERGLRPLVLHALQGALEHEVIARAGRPGRITVATQIAGRGTDIALDPEVHRQGGLHVLACADDFGARAWRQLVGRCARQGDPGSAETLLCSGEGVLFRRLPGRLAATLVGRPADSRLTAALWRLAQWLDELDGIRMRHALQRHERRQAGRMAWSGPEE